MCCETKTFNAWVLPAQSFCNRCQWVVFFIYSIASMRAGATATRKEYNSITFQEGKATLHQSRDCRHTHPFSSAPALGGLAKDMRRLQAVNKVEPIGWKSAFVILCMLCERWPGMSGMWCWPSCGGIMYMGGVWGSSLSVAGEREPKCFTLNSCRWSCLFKYRQIFRILL